jgi:predicted metalloprotease with PDZ domain
MHVVLDFDTDHDHDWIVEGLAEYYGLELLRRSGTISPTRFERARKAQKDWSSTSEQLCGGPSSGAMTARAVSIFVELDREIRRKTEGVGSLDDVVTSILAAKGDVDVDVLDRFVRDLIGENPDALHINKLPGCRKMSQP